ncbi:MaoC/PaaZ C-terminal domain-containing protein [Sinomonas sp. ASV322]|uniref:MaoC/PaaZ C-terminal domain-containing protein n=1 Tax=Sinomonas sp. ASV322 TaxID=3041920 RepID=UPI0027DB8D24|nr:MaoC/PaaZ C-terminal domain-containing protein [Sinomonas sp. ASV322]MDQ4501012.1 MaoC/PaaZ C-terminal domain-containing protein [Sinomonas sp. ASV322]
MSAAPARGIETVELPEMPSLSRLYVGAAREAAKKLMKKGAMRAALPAARHHVIGVRPDLGKMTAYQSLLGETKLDIAPAGYLHALAFPAAMSVMAREDFPLPLLGMVHVRNKVEYRLPVLYPDLLEVTAWAEGLAGHRAGTQVGLVVEVRHAGNDDVAWRGVSTYLARGVFLPGLDKPSPAGPRGEFRAPLPTALWRLGSETGREYAAVSGDFNPIHLSSISARALGMRRSIAHGMYTASRALAEVGAQKGDAFAWDVTFEAPVFLPARVCLNIADSVDDHGAWERSNFAGWSPTSGRRHFVGSVGRL